MDQTEAGSPPQQKYLTLRQAAFIGVGAMVGAGIFALLGAAGEVAGAAVWLSFLIAGPIAGLQGYSFAKLGARYPSAGGMLEYVAKGLGNGHLTGITSWLTYCERHRDRDGGGLVRQLFLGFGISTFTAKDLRQPSRQLPKAMYLALGIATVAYIAIALGVFTTLIHEPASIVTLVAILVLSIALDFGWKRARAGRADHLQAVH
jgi:amino acid transporter